MDMKGEQMLGIPYHEAALQVCIDGLEKEVLFGRVYGVRLGGPIVFADLTDFFAKIDQALDHQGAPQAYQKKRQFKNATRDSAAAGVPAEKSPMTPEQVQGFRGKLATATLRITSRQNATWQGQLIWLGQEDVIRFPSALELLRRMYEHLLVLTES